MAELQPNEIAVDRDQLKALIQDNKTKELEIRALYDASIKVMEIIGLAENGKMKAEVFEEDGGMFGEILKGAGDVIALAMKAQAPMGLGKKAEEKLKQKFSFFKDLLPLFIKYGNQFSQPVDPAIEASKPQMKIEK